MVTGDDASPSEQGAGLDITTKASPGWGDRIAVAQKVFLLFENQRPHNLSDKKTTLRFYR